MNNEILVKLKETVAELNIESLEDIDQLEAIIANEYSREYKKEANILVVSLRLGVADDILNINGKEISFFARDRMINQIVDGVSMEEATAAWAVDSLVYIMGKVYKYERKKGAVSFNDVRTSSEIEEIANPNKRGNTTGNITNGGIVAVQDGWIFYHNTYQKGNLYKIKMDGSQKTRLNNDWCNVINVLGQWIYYSNFTDHEKLYKIRLDGTGRTKISDDSCRYVNVVGDWIYYKNDSESGHLYKMKTDGSQRTKLSELSCSYINVVDEWIFYYNFFGIGKIKIDGSEEAFLIVGHAGYLNTEKDCIYYSSNKRSKYNSEKIYRYMISSNTENPVNGDSSEFVNVCGEWIYYSNKDDGYKLYKVKIDGSGMKKLSDEGCMNINVAGDWVYYLNYPYGNKLMRMKNDGTMREMVE